MVIINYYSNKNFTRLAITFRILEGQAVDSRGLIETDSHRLILTLILVLAYITVMARVHVPVHVTAH